MAPSRPVAQRGIAALMAVLFLLFMLSVVLVTAHQMAATDVHDSGTQNLSVGALFLAESGVERATYRYGNGTACDASLADALPITLGGGSFQVLASPAPLYDSGTGLCNLRVTGSLLGVSRTVAVGLRLGEAIAFRDSSTSNGGGGAVSSLTIARPVATVTGDVMLAQINVRGGTGVTITPPAGWTLVVPNGRLNSTNVLAQAVYYRAAGASEPANYIWTFTNGRASGGIAAFSGVNITTPINAANGQANNTSSTNIVAPSITTTATNTMLVGLFGLARVNAITEPAGMTEAYEVATGGGPNGVTSDAAYATQAATGATGIRTATSTAAVNIGHLVALLSSGSTALVTWSEP